MEYFIYDTIKRLGIFTVIAQTMIHFCPNTQYEKYIKVLIGIMSVTIVVTPFLGIVHDFSQEDFQSSVLNWEQKIEMTEEKSQIEISQEALMISQTEEEMKTRINRGITEETYIVKKVMIVQEQETINKIHITLTENRESQIAIDDIQIGEAKEHKSEQIKWEEICATILGIDQAYLEVTFI